MTLLHQEEACRNGRQQFAVRNMLTTTHQLRLLAEWLPSGVPAKLAKHYLPYFSKFHGRLVTLDELDQVIAYLLRYGHTQDRRMNVAGALAGLDAQRLVARNRLLDYFDGDKYSHTSSTALIDWMEQQATASTHRPSWSLRAPLPLWLSAQMLPRVMRYDGLFQARVPLPHDASIRHALSATAFCSSCWFL
jgi:hypothetical protein